MPRTDETAGAGVESEEDKTKFVRETLSQAQRIRRACHVHKKYEPHLLPQKLATVVENTAAMYLVR